MESSTHLSIPGLKQHIASQAAGALFGLFKRRDASTPSTKMWQAAERGDVKTVRKMLRHNFNIDSPLEFKDGAALHVAAQYGRTEVISALAESGANLELRNRVGATPLLVAAAFNKPDCVQRLVELGADVNAVDIETQPPLLYAATRGFGRVLRYLLSCRAVEVDAVNQSGATPLMAACEWGHAHAVQSLLEGGADPNARNPAGMTPAMFACMNDHDEALRCLIGTEDSKQRTDLSLRDKESRSAAEHARARGAIKCAALLEEMGAS